MIRFLISAVALVASSAAIAQSHEGGAWSPVIPADIKPCVHKTMTKAEAEREIRRLRWEGYYVTVQRGNEAPKVVSDGIKSQRPSLNTAYVGVSGCNK